MLRAERNKKNSMITAGGDNSLAEQKGNKRMVRGEW
jgi:hypothetical protein